MEDKYKVGDSVYVDLTRVWHLVGDVHEATITRVGPYKDHVNVEYREACCVPLTNVFDDFNDAVVHKHKLTAASQRFKEKERKRSSQITRMVEKAKAGRGAENRIYDELYRYCVAPAARIGKELVDNVSKSINVEKKLIIDRQREYISFVMEEVLREHFKELDKIFYNSKIFNIQAQNILYNVKLFAMAQIADFQKGKTDEVVYDPNWLKNLEKNPIFYEEKNNEKSK